MKKCILLICSVFILVGCNTNNEPQPEPQPEVVEEQIVEPVEEVVVEEVVVKPKKRASGTYYRMITKSIEVFSYKGRLGKNTQIEEAKLKNPFYVKGNLMKIAKVYESTIGEKYGKIAGKNLLVSMDDLTEYTKK